MNHAHDDDGVIDLRALASTRPPPGAFSVASPFASEPPAAAFVRDAGTDGAGAAHATPATRSNAKKIGIVAAAAAFVVLSGVGVAFAFRGEKAHVAARAPIAPPPPPVVAPAAPVADPGPAPAATANDDAPATKDATPKKDKGLMGARGAKSKSRSAGAPGARPVKPVVAKAADPCHCRGDFQCNIRCAANK